METPLQAQNGISIPKDIDLTRYACKLATESGKIVVMGMIIAWQVLNKLVNPRDCRFSDAVLLICSHLTIRERLQGLLPWKDRSYFELVPWGIPEHLRRCRFQIINWHFLQPTGDSRLKGVLQ
jgi:type III restriction enzyme